MHAASRHTARAAHGTNLLHIVVAKPLDTFFAIKSVGWKVIAPHALRAWHRLVNDASREQFCCAQSVLRVHLHWHTCYVNCLSIPRHTHETYTQMTRSRMHKCKIRPRIAVFFRHPQSVALEPMNQQQKRLDAQRAAQPALRATCEILLSVRVVEHMARPHAAYAVRPCFQLINIILAVRRIHAY